MKILISQQLPSNLAAYEILQNRFGAELNFQPFFLIEPLSAKEFRAEHINLPDYTAIVFSSRHAIDAYFKLSEEMRFKVPETMKYFCSTEAVAMYLQKHIVYRKRKIFYGAGTPASIVALITAKWARWSSPSPRTSTHWTCVGSTSPCSATRPTWSPCTRISLTSSRADSNSSPSARP